MHNVTQNKRNGSPQSLHQSWGKGHRAQEQHVLPTETRPEQSLLRLRESRSHATFHQLAVDWDGGNSLPTVANFFPTGSRRTLWGVAAEPCPAIPTRPASWSGHQCDASESQATQRQRQTGQVPIHNAGVNPQKLNETSASGSVMVGCETCSQLWVHNPQA